MRWPWTGNKKQAGPYRKQEPTGQGGGWVCEQGTENGTVAMAVDQQEVSGAEADQAAQIDRQEWHAGNDGGYANARSLAEEEWQEGQQWQNSMETMSWWESGMQHQDEALAARIQAMEVARIAVAARQAEYGPDEHVDEDGTIDVVPEMEDTESDSSSHFGSEVPLGWAPRHQRRALR